LRPRGSGRHAIDRTSAPSVEIRGVDDGVDAQGGDVGNYDIARCRSWRAVGSGRNRRADTLVGEQLLQLAGLERLADDVAAADKLALDVELRNGRPVR
jgi:hypothetical protein